MASRRGPDYAYDLTGEEQRALDRLLAAVPARRSRRALPVAAGIAAALVLAAAAAIPLLHKDPDRGRPPVAEGPAAVLTRLADQAAGIPDPSPAGPVLVRRTLEVRATGCTVDAYTATIRVGAGAALQQTPGHLTVEPATPPAAARELSGCPSPAARAAGTSYDGETTSLSATWAALGLWGYANPRGIADSTHSQDRRPIATLPTGAAGLAAALRTACAAQSEPDRAACRWTALVEILSSPEADAAHRLAALRAAAADGAATRVPAATADLTGRPGVTLRVPYLVPPVGRTPEPVSAVATADLTFDPGTGALLQRVERPRRPTDPIMATVYLAVTREGR